jgi:putative oxidoreductase
MNPAAPGSSSSRHDMALIILRVGCALVFLYHGSAILFGAFGGPGPQGFAAYKHWPVIIGYLVGAAQVFGGLAVLLGIFFRIGTVCLIVVMLGAIFTVHLPHGFDISKGGYEFALTELLIALALLLSGPGRYSIAASLPEPLRHL